MADPLRHRQTKGAATDMVDLTPPRHISTLPPTEPSETIGAKVRNGACVTNAPSAYDGAELYER